MNDRTRYKKIELWYSEHEYDDVIYGLDAAIDEFDLEHNPNNPYAEAILELLKVTGLIDYDTDTGKR